MLKRLISAALFIATLSSTGIAKADDVITIVDGPFKGDRESLKQYQCPQWFRDAKFGIWAHWGPQSVLMEGDWYARNMYQQGSNDYKYQVEHYGHPSKVGYKDIIPLWKAEKWDPQKLMALYKKAGAKYFVSMGTHHDNFFLWDSKIHRWNSVQMGPHRDVVGEWQKAATAAGLKFGVSEHLGASFTWFQGAHGSDKTGPLAGVAYDGTDPLNWDLYHFPAESGDTGWYSNNPKWQHEWYSEIKELVDNYHPDLLYSDGGVAFGNEVGLSMIAHFYNTNVALHDGKCEAVYNCKEPSGGRWVQDLERGIMSKIDPNPWQTDTSIGDWFYNKHWKIRPVSWVIDMLVDNVSKNGNLLINVVQRPDGSIDDDVLAELQQLADWNAIHGEAIFGSRPWLVYGEGPVRAKSGSFNEDYKYTARDIRFTTKGDILYAIALGWPVDGQVVVHSLGKPEGQDVNNITAVSLLGYEGKVDWKQTPDGLVVILPRQKISEYSVGLKIIGTHLKNVPIDSASIQPDANGTLTLTPEFALTEGRMHAQRTGMDMNLGYWDSPDDFATWTVKFTRLGTYNVATQVSSLQGADFAVEVGDQILTAKAPATGSWEQYQTATMGKVIVKQPGIVTVKLRAKDAAHWQPVNVKAIVIKPE